MKKTDKDIKRGKDRGRAIWIDAELLTFIQNSQKSGNRPYTKIVEPLADTIRRLVGMPPLMRQGRGKDKGSRKKSS